VVICHCRRVNDRAISATVEAGARSVGDVAAGCGAGSRCGGCWPSIQELLAKLTDGHPRRSGFDAVPSPS
jgi:bacterioferritin-associated ferredoxin